MDLTIVAYTPAAPSPASSAQYLECLRNHAAALGGHAFDGCGEFMPSGPPKTLAALTCAACGCHRNFHRRHPPSPLVPLPLAAAPPPPELGGGRKRGRTRFTAEQKERMQEFAGRLGWRIPRSDDEELVGFCEEIGVDRRVLKVWMHNHKQQQQLSLPVSDGDDGDGIRV